MLGGKILQEDIPEVAFGNPESVRRAHLSLPTLLELHMELQKRGFLLQGKKPRTVLDMMHCIETLFEKTRSSSQPWEQSRSAMSIWTMENSLSEWLSSRQRYIHRCNGYTGKTVCRKFTDPS